MIRQTVYKAVRDLIAANMPWVRFIDLQKGQFDTPAAIKENYPFPMPTVLIEIKPITWKSVLNRVQHGDTTITIWIYLDHSGNSFKGSEQEQESLSLMDRMDEMFQVLTDLSIEHTMQRLVRSGDGVAHYRPRMVVFRVDFTTVLYDSRNLHTAKLPVDLVSVPELVEPLDV